eukprot:3623737-Pleurochrysis_carterae.AAC.4
MDLLIERFRKVQTGRASLVCAAAADEGGKMVFGDACVTWFRVTCTDCDLRANCAPARQQLA